MEDELEDRVFYQTYASHARLMARASLPACGWSRLARAYLLRYEVVVFGVAMIALLLYVQAVDVRSRALLGRLISGRAGSAVPPTPVSGPRADERNSWEARSNRGAAYALQGRRPRMEDRFVLDDDLRGTGVSLFAVFDGHGGEFAADFAKDKLISAIADRIEAVKRRRDGSPEPNTSPAENPLTAGKTPSFKRSRFAADDSAKKQVTDPELLSKLNAARGVTREVSSPTSSPTGGTRPPLSSYLRAGKIDYGKLISDEVLAVDEALVREAKKTMDVAGTTALLALVEDDLLTVANIGDSRGVMCDSKGNAIPLSFDHKPQQMREKKRIEEAGGYIAFNGVWRVAGILATSRAMGDYPLKDKKFVVAEPDVLTFNLTDHRPSFMILATDGLWDTFTNEEAVGFIKERLDEPHYGAKSLTLQSYYRGSVDNITILVIHFGDGRVARAETS